MVGLKAPWATAAISDPVTSTQETASAAPVPAPVKHSTRIAQVRNVGVVQGKNGIEVEISANAPLSPNALKLTRPDRIVVDLANAAPLANNNTISANSRDLKAVRIS